MILHFEVDWNLIVLPQTPHSRECESVSATTSMADLARCLSVVFRNESASPPGSHLCWRNKGQKWLRHRKRADQMVDYDCQEVVVEAPELAPNQRCRECSDR